MSEGSFGAEDAQSLILANTVGERERMRVFPEYACQG